MATLNQFLELQEKVAELERENTKLKNEKAATSNALPAGTSSSSFPPAASIFHPANPTPSNHSDEKMRRVEERLLSNLSRCTAAAMGTALYASRDVGNRAWTCEEVEYYFAWKRGSLGDLSCPSTLDDFDDTAADGRDGDDEPEPNLAELLRGVSRRFSPFEDPKNAAPKELDPLGRSTVYAWCRPESLRAPRSEAEVEAIASEFTTLMADALRVSDLNVGKIEPCIRSGSGAAPVETWLWHRGWKDEQQPLRKVSSMMSGPDCHLLAMLGPTGLSANPWSMCRIAERFAEKGGAIMSIMVSGEVQIVSASEVHRALLILIDFLRTSLLDPSAQADTLPTVYRAKALAAAMGAAARISEVSSDGLAPGVEFAKRLVLCFLERVAESHVRRWKWALSTAPDGISDVRRWPVVMSPKNRCRSDSTAKADISVLNGCGRRDGRCRH